MIGLFNIIIKEKEDWKTIKNRRRTSWWGDWFQLGAEQSQWTGGVGPRSRLRLRLRLRLSLGWSASTPKRASITNHHPLHRLPLPPIWIAKPASVSSASTASSTASSRPWASPARRTSPSQPLTGKPERPALLPPTPPGPPLPPTRLSTLLPRSNLFPSPQLLRLPSKATSFPFAIPFWVPPLGPPGSMTRVGVVSAGWETEKGACFSPIQVPSPLPTMMTVTLAARGFIRFLIPLRRMSWLCLMSPPFPLSGSDRLSPPGKKVTSWEMGLSEPSMKASLSECFLFVLHSFIGWWFI